MCKDTHAGGSITAPRRVPLAHLAVSGLHGSDQDAPLHVRLGSLGVQVGV